MASYRWAIPPMDRPIHPCIIGWMNASLSRSGSEITNGHGSAKPRAAVQVVDRDYQRYLLVDHPYHTRGPAGGDRDRRIRAHAERVALFQVLSKRSR